MRTLDVVALLAAQPPSIRSTTDGRSGADSALSSTWAA
ncbi:hypothetical protein SANTM175S_02701 [Streptomyces antimycoticus]